VVVYDSLGKEIPVTFYFRKTGDNAWDLHTKIGSEDPSRWLGLTFDSTTGKLATMDPADDPPTLTVNGQAIRVPFPEATQFASSFGVTNLAQDGYTAGDLTSIGVEPDGNILARYSNGKSMSAGQLVLANFRNPQGLQPLGGNVWARTFASGDVVQNNPGDGGLGVMQSGALEDSNIDLTGELVNMITAQRIYQANAQTIKTQDQVMQTLVNLR
jgi:flagellar hook protein FlgE